MIDLAVVASAPHQLRCAAAVVSGINTVGGTARVHRAGARLPKHVCCWGWRTGKRLRAQGHDVLVMERAYLGDRFAWYSLGWNGLNGRASFPGAPSPARFKEHFSDLLQPWKKGGNYVLLIGQVPGDMSLQGRDLADWYEEAALAARVYGLPVRFRPHPVAVQRGYYQPAPAGSELSTGSLAEALASAAVCITYNSNTAVEAVLAGVPTVAVDPGSMAWSVTGHTIGDLKRPARAAWATKLAGCQWRLPEIEAGTPFKDWNADDFLRAPPFSE